MENESETMHHFDNVVPICPPHDTLLMGGRSFEKLTTGLGTLSCLVCGSRCGLFVAGDHQGNVRLEGSHHQRMGVQH